MLRGNDRHGVVYLSGLPGEVEAYANHVVVTVVGVCLGSYGRGGYDGAILIEGVHVAEVDVEESAGMDAHTATEGVAGAAETDVVHILVLDSVHGLLP